MIDPLSEKLLNEIGKRAGAEARKQSIAYRRQCPRCGKWQIKETMSKQGCFACGWNPKRGEKNEGK